MKHRHVIALGGGGFSAGPKNRVLAEYILSLTQRSKPRVCFLPTASGDAALNIKRFYRACESLGAVASHLLLFQAFPKQASKALAAQDVIYVGGGNTRNMLVLWKEWGIDTILRQALARGTILAGTSAGAICWFEQGLTDSNPGGYTPIDALGWLKGSCCPHFDSEPRRQRIFRSLIRLGKLAAGYAIDDGVGLHFINGTLTKVISSRRTAGARFIQRQRGKLLEQLLVPTRL
jgi:dipeptidase E